jgi:hypothetical protein
MAFFMAPGCSTWFLGILGAQVDDARDGSWRRCFTVWLYLVAKPSHEGSMWMGSPTPYTVLWPRAIRPGDRPPTRRCLVPSLQWVVVPL